MIVCAYCGKKMGDSNGSVGMLVIHVLNKHYKIIN